MSALEVVLLLALAVLMLCLVVVDGGDAELVAENQRLRDELADREAADRG